MPAAKLHGYASFRIECEALGMKRARALFEEESTVFFEPLLV